MHERPLNVYHDVIEPPYNTVALFFCCTISSSHSFTAMTRLVQWLRASFKTCCESESGSMKSKCQSAEVLPHQYAPESPALQVDGGATSVPFPSNLRSQKLLALKVPPISH